MTAQGRERTIIAKWESIRKCGVLALAGAIGVKLGG